MTIVDPFSSEKQQARSIILEPFEIIASTLLDDDPTTVSSGEIIVPDSDSELVVLLEAEVTAGSPTNILVDFEVSYDGISFYTIDDFSVSDWSQETILASAMPVAIAYARGRVAAPYFRVTITGTGTTGSDSITVQAWITRIPAAVRLR
jgi:hypothetical protein